VGRKTLTQSINTKKKSYNLLVGLQRKVVNKAKASFQVQVELKINANVKETSTHRNTGLFMYVDSTMFIKAKLK